ncbi:YtxH domain-containing protein [Cytobacillus spongiae]|jgi:gas vesicle protein|uniref:YtxH domain-containing protein n=1 Tax=Cytobacillus spongiae TaxID=2901381 RepID=UPI001F280D15|nr:YtxH domain-containing protein [Cytobacillus spongiae]UII56884.1 YtxH domain-containing protein [Cytobacillus spongiae]
MRGKSAFIGFVVGGAAAAIATLLTAPASGNETRKNLQANKKIWSEHIQELQESIIEVKNSAIKLSQQGKGTITALTKDLNHSISTWKKEVEPHQQAIQDELRAIEHSIEELESKPEN